VDFGLAKLAPARVAAADATLTVLNTDAGTLLGTVTYMSLSRRVGRKSMRAPISGRSASCCTK